MAALSSSTLEAIQAQRTQLLAEWTRDLEAPAT